MKLPVDAVAVVVNATAELASPPGGGVTDCGIPIVTPVGAAPTHDAEKLMGELKPPSESTIIDAPALRPGITDTVVEDEATEKYGGTKAGTGARTDGVPSIVTVISDE